jgi:hypothetical protein
MRRLLEATGLQRRPRDVTPTLKEYLAARAIEMAPGNSNALGVSETPADSKNSAYRLPAGTAEAP